MIKALICLTAVLSIGRGQQPEGQIARFGTTVVIPSGLKGSIYTLRRNTKHLPNFDKRKPIGSIYTESLDIPPQDFREGFPGVTDRYEWFAIDYKGRFWIEVPGVYTFHLTSDDGAKLYLDDDLVIDNDGQHPVLDKEGEKRLERGVHRVRVSYFQGPRFHVALVLKVQQGPEDKLRVFSTNEFKPPPGIETWPLPEK